MEIKALPVFSERESKSWDVRAKPARAADQQAQPHKNINLWKAKQIFTSVVATMLV